MFEIKVTSSLTGNVEQNEEKETDEVKIKNEKYGDDGQEEQQQPDNEDQANNCVKNNEDHIPAKTKPKRKRSKGGAKKEGTTPIPSHEDILGDMLRNPQRAEEILRDANDDDRRDWKDKLYRTNQLFFGRNVSHPNQKLLEILQNHNNTYHAGQQAPKNAEDNARWHITFGWIENYGNWHDMHGTFVEGNPQHDDSERRSFDPDGKPMRKAKENVKRPETKAPAAEFHYQKRVLTNMQTIMRAILSENKRLGR